MQQNDLNNTSEQAIPVVATPIVDIIVPFNVVSSIEDALDINNTKLAIIEMLQGSLSTFYDLEVTIRIPKYPRFGSFFGTTSLTTTLRQHFLSKMRDPEIDEIYIGNVYNALVARGDPGRFFERDNHYTTKKIANAAYNAFNEPLVQVTLASPVIATNNL